MAMKLQAVFKRPLSIEQRRAVLIVVGGHIKVRRIGVNPSGWDLTVIAEDLGSASLAKLLKDAGLEPSTVRTSLTPESDAACEEKAEAESVRAPGR